MKKKINPNIKDTPNIFQVLAVDMHLNMVLPCLWYSRYLLWFQINTGENIYLAGFFFPLQVENFHDQVVSLDVDVK